MSQKYRKGDKHVASVEPTVASLLGETIEFEGDLASLLLDLRKVRDAMPPGPERSKLRAVGNNLENALQHVKIAVNVVRGLPVKHDGRGPG